jgi:hypothetical protein
MSVMFRKAPIIDPHAEITKVSSPNVLGCFPLSNVKSIIFDSPRIFKYFPLGLDQLFPNLCVIKIIECGLKKISRENLAGLVNLEFLDLSHNELQSQKLCVQQHPNHEIRFADADS